MSGERVPIKIFQNDKEACRAVARRIADCIRRKNAEGRPAVLGLATGHTPINVYRELARLHREEKLDFSRVITFNLDEYWPIDPAALQSYHRWMHENFFRFVNVPPKNIHIPSGAGDARAIASRLRCAPPSGNGSVAVNFLTSGTRIGGRSRKAGEQ